MCIFLNEMCTFAYITVEATCVCENAHICIFMHACALTCLPVCVSPGCLEEAGSGVSRQHRGGRPPAAHQTASGRLLPAVLQHGGELCVTARTPSTESRAELIYMIMYMDCCSVTTQGTPISFTSSHSDWSFERTLQCLETKGVTV